MATTKKTYKRTAKKAPAAPIEWQRMISEMLTMEGSMSDTYSRFYDYSISNKILLYMQGVTEPVATYKAWATLGRQVKKGAKAKQIMRPVPVTFEDDTKKDADGNPKKTSFMKFTLVNCLFTFSDTEGDDLPPATARAWDKAKAIETLELTEVKFDALVVNANTQGYSFKRNFAIHPAAKYPLKTMFHEFGHIVIGHTDAAIADNGTLTRDVKEFQAEAVAYIVANDLKVEERDKAESRAYVQGWLKDNKPTDKEIRQVFGAADKILKAGK